MQAWDNCNKYLTQKELKIEPQITADARTVDIRVAYQGPGNGVELEGVQQEGFSCRVQVPAQHREQDPHAAILVKGDAVNVHCSRSKSTTVVRDGTTYDVLPRGTITIQTAGESLQLFFAPEYDPGLPVREAERLKRALAQTPPLGSVIPFVGGAAGLASLPTEWIPCDGRFLSKASYPELFKAIGGTWGTDPAGDQFRVPDLRGRFLRGSGQGNGGGEPAGDPSATPGRYEADSVKAHSHVVPIDSLVAEFRGLLASTSVGNSEQKTGFANGGAFSDGNTGGITRVRGPLTASPNSDGAETRPYDAIVTWVIRAK